MRNTLAIAALLLATTIGAQAQQKSFITTTQDNLRSSPRLNMAAVEFRADRLSDQMVRQLRLNGYQASRLRTINEDKVAKMAAIEQKHAGNQKLIDEQCKGVCKERDKELASVLSTDQYTNYYDSRSVFYKYDKDYAARSSNIMLVKSVQEPLPASSKGSVIAPSRPQGRSTPASTVRGR
ncbi:hypothetical protein [Hymenobacter sp. DG25A]|jgi:hypothetical protein|uniref:hypothetical protein n=1 Tax=Hymenobacter sp. DG25A TaxID=1385663 RepID=UPI0012F93851|nr:hypothetical protein [Hymenobacter sp. DG25A]